MVALHHIPNDAPQRVVPLIIEGDGNCFPRTISYILYKSETKYSEIHAHIVYEAVINMDSYLDNIYVSIGARNFYDRGTLPEQYVQYSDNYILNTGVELDAVALYKQEVLDITKNRAFMGIWQVFQATNVLKRPI